MKMASAGDRSTPSSVWLVDASNVRAAMGWPDASAFSHAVVRWAHQNATARSLSAVIVVRDGGHAGLQSARLLSGAASVVECFSGRTYSADDAIVRDAVFWLRGGTTGVVVVTSDKLLRARCRHAVRGGDPRGGGHLPPTAASEADSAAPLQNSGAHLANTAGDEDASAAQPDHTTRVPAGRLVLTSSEDFGCQLRIEQTPLSSSASGEALPSSVAQEYMKYVALQPRPPNTARSFKQARAGITPHQRRGRKR
jgi:hypothetical protein